MGIEPTHISSVMLYQLSCHALSSKVVGRRGILVLALVAHFLRLLLYIFVSARQDHWNVYSYDFHDSQLKHAPLCIVLK